MPDLTRRSALVLGAGVVGAGIVAQPAVASAATARLAVPGRSHYRKLVGRTFVAAGANGRHAVTLVKIHDVVGAKSSAREHAFTLVFKAHSAALPDGIYRLTAKGIATSELFLGGLGPAHLGRSQALVNRAR